MTIPRRRRPIALLLLLAVCANAHAGSPNAGSAHAVSANGNPDAGLYGSFDFDDAFDTAYLSVCGSVPGSDGCYGSATLSGFGRIGAMMESSAVVTANLGTVSREIFVVDQAVGGGTSTAMSLSVYRLTIVVNAPEAACTLVLLKTIPLPNTGGLNAHTYMAANAHYLFIGTDQDPYAVRVNAVSYVVSKAPGPTPPTKVSSITADDYGYVDVTFGSLGGSGAVRAYDSAGTDLGLTSGEAFKLGSGQGLSTTDVLATQVADVPAIVRYHPSANDVAATNPNPDAGLSIDYGFDPTFRTVTWKLCGSVPGSSGCYGNGTIGTFGHIGAMVQGLVSIDKTNDIVRRDLYIFDQAVGGGSSTTVGLYVYRMTETIAAPNVTVTVNKIKSLGLPLVGGANAKSFIAGDQSSVYTGTDQNSDDEQVDKSSYGYFALGGFSPPSPASGITTDQYGFVAVTFGGISGADGFFVLDPDGGTFSDGGGSAFLLGTVQAFSTADVSMDITPLAKAPRPIHVNYHPKQ